MRIAALYDIHGNLPALEAVLHEVTLAAVDAVVVGGDVLPGPLPRECLELLDSTGIPTEYIHGNGESAALEALSGSALEKIPEAFREGIRWSAGQLTADQRAAIAAWPLTVHLDATDLGDVLFCHATPRNDTEIFTRLSPDERVATMFAGVTSRVSVCGHTHMQFDRTAGPVRVVNAGSVGMPFADAGAYWLLLGPDVQLRRTSYDLVSAAERLRRSDFPGAASFADQVLSPSREADMLTAYARADGRAP